jgi:hypothetical protein
MPKSVKINLSRFNKQFSIKNDIHKKFFERMLVSEYVRVYGDQYYNEMTPVGIQVIVCEKLRHSVERKHVIGESSISKGSILGIMANILSSLVDVAYDKENQVTEINIQKVYGVVNSIEIEVYNIEK